LEFLFIDFLFLGVTSLWRGQAIRSIFLILKKGFGIKKDAATILNT